MFSPAQDSPKKIIPNPCSALFGVSINSDGSFENVGIGSFSSDKAEELSERLVALAGAIKATAHKRLSSG